jgi:hypothetical protein
MKDQSTDFGFNQSKKHKLLSQDDTTLQSQEDLDAYYNDTQKRKCNLSLLQLHHLFYLDFSFYSFYGCFSKLFYKYTSKSL